MLGESNLLARVVLSQDNGPANAPRLFPFSPDPQQKARSLLWRSQLLLQLRLWLLVLLWCASGLAVAVYLILVPVAGPSVVAQQPRTVDRDGNPLPAPAPETTPAAGPDARVPAWGSCLTGLGALLAAVAAWLQTRTTHRSVVTLATAAVAAVTPPPAKGGQP